MPTTKLVIPDDLMAELSETPQVLAHVRDEEARTADRAAAHQANNLKLQEDTDRADVLVGPIAKGIADSIHRMLEATLTDPRAVEVIVAINKILESSRNNSALSFCTPIDPKNPNHFDSLFSAPGTLYEAFWHIQKDRTNGHFDGFERPCILRALNPLNTWLKNHNSLPEHLRLGSGEKLDTEYIHRMADSHLCRRINFWGEISGEVLNPNHEVLRLLNSPERKESIRREVQTRLRGLKEVVAGELVRAYSSVRIKEWSPENPLFKANKKPGKTLRVRHPFASSGSSGLLHVCSTFNPVIDLRLGGYHGNGEEGKPMSFSLGLVQNMLPASSKTPLVEVDITSLVYCRSEERPWFYVSEDGKIHVPHNPDCFNQNGELFEIHHPRSRSSDNSPPIDDWRLATSLKAFVNKVRKRTFELTGSCYDKPDLLREGGIFQVVCDNLPYNPLGHE